MESTKRIVTDIAALSRAWEDSPLVSRGLGGFDDVFSAAIAQRIIHAGIPFSALRLYKNGKQLEKANIAKRSTVGENEPRANGAALIDQIGNGATLVIEYLKQLCPEVANFATALAQEVGLNTYCAAFITPAGANGLIPHYDTESVFLRQVHGSKQWCVKTPIQKWPVRAWRSTMRLNTKQVLDVSLKKGDCLYIPRGYVHSAGAAEEGSIHITISIIPTTWADVLRAAVEDSINNTEELRECIPPHFSDTNGEALFHQKLAALHIPRMDPLRPQDESAKADELASALRR